MRLSNSPAQNGLLAALSSADYDRLLPELALVVMPRGWVIHEPAGLQSYVYFPTTSVVSLVCAIRDGSSAEIAFTGNEGFVGVSILLGSVTSTSRAIVQRAGYAYRANAEVMTREFERRSALQEMALRYSLALIAQMAQAAACNCHHSIIQRLSRRLLGCLDQQSNNHIAITQESLGYILGVRRETVTDAAGELQKLGVIRCARGYISVLDRTRLEAQACECYRVVKKELERLLPKPHAETFSAIT